MVKKLEYEQRGPMTMIQVNDHRMDEVFEEIEKRMGARFVSAHERELPNALAAKTVFATDHGSVIDWRIASIAGQDPKDAVKMKLYYPDSLSPTVQRVLEEHQLIPKTA